MRMGLADKIVLLFCCTALYFASPQFGRSVVPILIAICFVSLLSYFEQPLILSALIAGFLIWSMFLPSLVLFLPVVLYHAFMTDRWYFCLIAAVPAVSFCSSMPAWLSVSVCILLFLGLLLRYRTFSLEKLQAERNELRDNAKEMSIQLNQKNHDLLEQRDTEIANTKLSERNRIARDIHDSVGHLLSSALLQVGALLAINRNQALSPNLNALKHTLSEAMDSIRTSVHDLYDESIDLYAQLHQLTKNFTFCSLDFQYDLDTDPPSKIKYTFLFIVKEGLSNIIRHSNADKAEVILREHPAFYQLIISDNGSVEGYDPENGIGLKNMEERIHSLHGVLNLTTKRGFRIFISVPKGEQDPCR